MGDVAISPDGMTVAFVRRRPLLSAGTYQQPALLGNDRGDIWISSLSGGSPLKLTDGDSDGSGYWRPTWSPDGTRLAMLSTKGLDNVRLWVWEKATGRLTKLSERGVAFTLPSPFAWIDNQQLLAVLLSEGEKPLAMTVERRAGDVAMHQWPKAWNGRETTASVLDSGVPVDLASRQHEDVVLIDLKGRAQLLESAASILDLRAAPDSKHFAFLKGVSLLTPDPATLLQHYGYEYRYQLEVTSGNRRINPTDKIHASVVLPESFQWSPDGRSFAFIGTAGNGSDVLHVFRGMASGQTEEVSLAEKVNPRSVIWADKDHLLLSAEHETRTDRKLKKRLDWWMLSMSRSPQILTDSLKTAPSTLVGDSTGRIVIGVADGDVWQLDLELDKWTNLTAALDQKFSSIAWPNVSDDWGVNFVSRPFGFAHVVVSARHGQFTDYYRVDMSSGALTRIARPTDLATLVAYDDKRDVALFTSKESRGTSLTIVQGRESRLVVTMSSFLRGIAEGERRMIEYRSLDGEDLKGWLILPANYQPGKRYPLVTWVYAGTVFEDALPALSSLNLEHSLNLQLLAARGYAVLRPSMPLKPEGEVSDPYMELTKGVLPAVDKVIELGIADPKRLAVMGQSFGGFSTYGLITQTNRFQAAIALAGPSNFVSLYGVFDARWRYELNSQERLYSQSVAETGQLRMGNPPWRDLGRYLRNSPITYVDRVRTPVLIVQGDMDAISITQGEEFFTALYRQGKRARFIRYWGEGHTLLSPANIRDFWMHTYAWLDEFCDISRDDKGNLIFDGDHVKSRNGAPSLKPEDFARFNEIELKSHPWVKQ